MDLGNGVLFCIYNIPKYYDSFSLREFFEDLIYKEAFLMFEYHNRPEKSLRKIICEYFPNVKLKNKSNLNDNLKPSDSNSIQFPNKSTLNTFDFRAFIDGGDCKTKENDESLDKNDFEETERNTGFIVVKHEFVQDLEKLHDVPWCLEEKAYEVDGNCYLAKLGEGWCFLISME